MTREIYTAFGFTRSRHPPDAAGEVPRPDRALGRRRGRAAPSASSAPAFPVTPLPGQGAFYGPKIGFDFKDVLERTWTAGDGADRLRHARAFRAAVRDAGGQRGDAGDDPPRGARLDRALHRHPARAHRWPPPALAGAGAGRVLPVSEKVAEYAARVEAACRAAGVRAEADLRNEKLGYKVRQAELEKVPLVAVVGEARSRQGTVRPARRDGEPRAGHVRRAHGCRACVPGGGSIAKVEEKTRINTQIPCPADPRQSTPTGRSSAS